MPISRLLLCIGLVVGCASNKPAKFSHKAAMDHFRKKYPGCLKNGYAKLQTHGSNKEFQLYFPSDQYGARLHLYKVNHQQDSRLVGTYTLNLKNKNNPDQCNRDSGCQWNPSLIVKVKDEWKSGLYSFRTTKTKEYNSNDTLIVLPPGIKKNRFLFVFDEATNHAYNFYGGTNFYFYFAGGKLNKLGIPAFSQNLPGCSLFLNRTPPKMKNTYYGVNIASRIQRVRPLDWVSNLSLEYWSPEDINAYDAVFVGGTQEYLTGGFLQKLADYVDQGGNLVIYNHEFALFPISKDPKAPGRFLLTRGTDGPKPYSRNPDYSEFWGGGYAIGYGIPFPTKEVSQKWANWDHPLLEGINHSDPVKGLGLPEPWTGSANIVSNENGGYCVENQWVPCRNSNVIAWWRVKRPENFYEWVLESDLKTRPLEYQTTGLTIIKKGKGRIVNIPHKILTDQDASAFLFLSNFNRWINGPRQ